MPYFLYFTKSRKKVAARRRSVAAGNTKRRHGRRKRSRGAAKKAHGVCRPDRDKLSAKRKVSKGFNFVRGKVLFGCAESRFAKPRCSLQRERVYSFRLYEKNQKYPRGLRTSGLRGRFKALPEVILQKVPAASAETGFACKTAAKRL